MIVTRKLILAIVAVIVVVMVADTLLRIERESEILASDTTRDHLFIGRTLAGAYAEVARREGPARAAEVLRAADTGHPSVRARLVCPTRGALPGPLREPSRLGAVTRGEELIVTDAWGSYTYVPVVRPDAPPCAVEVAEADTAHRNHVRDSVTRNVAIMVVVVLFCAGTATALGYWLIARRLARLEERARRIGEGDLATRLTFKEQDEIADLASEMNEMCERLEGARRAVREEAAAKLTALEQLRHADRLRTVGQLASGLAHELGTPLSVVLGRASLLVEGTPGREEVLEHATVIADQIRRMTALFRQLLDFARRRGPQSQPTDLGELVEGVSALLRPMAQKRGIPLKFSRPSPPVRAEVDPGQVQQVITNLVMNALQATTGEGEVTLSVGREARTPPADVGGPEATFCFVRVEDRGKGIAPEDLERVFEPFFTTKDVGEGTGLGLSVAYGIARDHGGWITVESEPGRGSTFTLFVPAARASLA